MRFKKQPSAFDVSRWHKAFVFYAVCKDGTTVVCENVWQRCSVPEDCELGMPRWEYMLYEGDDGNLSPGLR